MTITKTTAAVVAAVTTMMVMALSAQTPAFGGPPPGLVTGPAPTIANVDYAPADPATSNGHKLDLYLPANVAGPMPLVIWTGGSAWMADTGKALAGGVADKLNPAGYAVAGVSIRSSSQVKFPGQLYDIKAAIRFLRANAVKYRLDPNHIAIVGDSSGGWTASMAAVTGDATDIEGSVGTTGVSSAVQAAVALYPPTSFVAMDAYALRKCEAPRCHDSEQSPESQLLGCAIQSCPDKMRAASPLAYITTADPPIMILHGNWNGFLTDDALREGSTMRPTVSAGCVVTNPVLYTPTWTAVIALLDRNMKAPATQQH